MYSIVFNVIWLMIIYFYLLVVLHLIPTGGTVTLSEVQIFSLRADYLVHTLVFLPFMPLVWFYLNSRALKTKKRRRLVLLWFGVGLSMAALLEALHYCKRQIAHTL